MRKIFIITLLMGIVYAGIPMQKYLPANVKLSPEQIGKGANLKGSTDRRSGIHDGNKIRLKFFNTGVMGGPSRVDPWPRLEWPAGSGHEYIYEMGPIVGARVKAYDPNRGDSVWVSIVDDPIQDGGDEDFEPLPGYINPLKQSVAFSDKDTLWPQIWPMYTSILGDTIVNLTGKWASQFNSIFCDSSGNFHRDSIVEVVKADQESFFAVTDSSNEEFLPNNTYGNPWYDPGNGLKGLGIKMSVRGYQWSATSMEDAIIWVYDVENLSNKDIDSMVIGFFVDVRIGGPGSDFDDDMYTYDSTNNMVLFYDGDGQGRGADGRPYPTGWMGFMFLESPGDDSHQHDGEDNNGNWDPATDDIGRDGLPGTHDYGEGDDTTTFGEPHFEVMDPLEKEQLGLTGVKYFQYGQVFAGQDSAMLELMRPGFDAPPPPGDFITLFSSGFFSLPRGKKQRFSIAVIMGEDSADLYRNAGIVKKVFENGYSYPKPPKKPHLWITSASGRVTLHWDNIAESDPNFEGYAIYRSEDRGVHWGNPITDAFGRIVYWRPIAQFDKVDSIQGLSSIGVNGAYFYLGNNSGLKHVWTDTTVIDGKHYWYAVTAYTPPIFVPDIIPPLMTGLTPLEGNPSIKEVIPTGRALGYIPPHATLDTMNSNVVGTGDIIFDMLEPDSVKQGSYEITFDSVGGSLAWSLKKILQDTSFYILRNLFTVHGEDGNPIFDNMRLIINSDQLAPDTNYWVSGNSNYRVEVSLYPRGGRPIIGHYEIEFADSDSTLGYVLYNSLRDSIPVNFKVYRVLGNMRVPQPVIFLDGDGDRLITNTTGSDILIVMYRDPNTSSLTPSWQFKFFGPSENPIDPNSNGNILFIKMHNPFTIYDTLRYNLIPGERNDNEIKQSLSKVKVVPNPYILTDQFELKDPFIQRGRGAREIHFIDLPPEAVIRIYTITGELVATLHHVEGDPGYLSRSVQKWNLLNKDGQEIAYGVYIYHVEALNGGKVIAQQIGKFAIIK